MIIGLTGRIASGKGEIAEFLKEKGFDYYTISKKVREVAGKVNIPIKRESLQDFANLIRKYEGAGAWVRRIIAENVKDIEKRDYVIDGIRNPGEIEELKKTGNFILISIDAPFEIRYERVLKRNKDSDPKEKEEFIKIDERDFGEENPEGQQVGKCMAMADFQIINNSTLEELNRQIEEFYKKIIPERR